MKYKSKLSSDWFKIIVLLIVIRIRRIFQDRSLEERNYEILVIGYSEKLSKTPSYMKKLGDFDVKVMINIYLITKTEVAHDVTILKKKLLIKNSEKRVKNDKK